MPMAVCRGRACCWQVPTAGGLSASAREDRAGEKRLGRRALLQYGRTRWFKRSVHGKLHTRDAEEQMGRWAHMIGTVTGSTTSFVDTAERSRRAVGNVETASHQHEEGGEESTPQYGTGGNKSGLHPPSWFCCSIAQNQNIDRRWEGGGGGAGRSCSPLYR
jgi:hypothetical protein